jgi:phosphoglycerate dehydrogenase-like enzyme
MMTPMNIVITDKIDIDAQATEKIRQLPATVFEDTPKSDEEIIERVKDAEIITANYIDITPKIIDACTKLKYIIVPAVGYEWVDYKYAASKGVRVINSPTHNSLAVAEHAFALLFAVIRNIYPAQSSLQAGTWQSRNFRGIELHGKKLGLVGYGNIGKNIESMAKGLGMDCSYVNSKSTSEDLDTLLSSSDVVILCVPLNDATRGLIDARRLALLKPTAYLVNVARGAIVDQDALLGALRESKIAGAALDVFVDEPLAGVPSEQIVELAKLPNVVATPHIGYNTEETTFRLGEEIYSSIVACVNEQPVNIVN